MRLELRFPFILLLYLYNITVNIQYFSLKKKKENCDLSIPSFCLFVCLFFWRFLLVIFLVYLFVYFSWVSVGWDVRKHQKWSHVVVLMESRPL